MYKPGLPGNPAPVIFDTTLDWRPALAALKNYANSAENDAENVRTGEDISQKLPTGEEFSDQKLRAGEELSPENYAIKLSKTDPITIPNYTVLRDGVVTIDQKALAQAAHILLDHLLALDQWDAIADPASHAGLLHSGQIQTWLESGADPHRDIIETVRVKLAYLHRQGKRRHVKSWDFFTQPIAEAKARRERGLPTIALGNGVAVTGSGYRKNCVDKQDRDPLAHLTPEQRARADARAMANKAAGGNHA
jgi:hypothetical protein